MRTLAAFLLLPICLYAQDMRNVNAPPASAVLIFADGTQVDHDTYWASRGVHRDPVTQQMIDGQVDLSPAHTHAPSATPRNSSLMAGEERRRLSWRPVNSYAIPLAITQASANIVRTTNRSGRVTNRGSGTYLGAGLVSICRHTVDNDRARVYFDSAVPPCAIDGTVVARLQGKDAALIMLDELPPLPGIRVASRDPVRGEKSYALGYSGGRRQLNCHPGQIVGYTSGRGYVVQSGQSIGGDSGGPILNESGELIGNLWGGGNGETVGVRTTDTLRLLAPYRKQLSAWYGQIDAGNHPWKTSGIGVAIGSMCPT